MMFQLPDAGQTRREKCLDHQGTNYGSKLPTRQSRVESRDINDVVGRKAKRAVNINQIIRTRHLELDYAIKKDQSVIIESKIGPVTVVSAGIAVDDAQLGERVKVKNNSSGLLVEGVAISEKKIRIRAK